MSKRTFSRATIVVTVVALALFFGTMVLAQSSPATLVQRSQALKITLPIPSKGLAFARGTAGVPATHAPTSSQLPGSIFEAAATYGSDGSEAVAVAVADVNGDGRPDLVVLNNCAILACASVGSVVGVLLGNGDGTFQPAVAYGTGGTNAWSMAVADVNGDGKPDLVVANTCVGNICATSGTVGVLLGNGDGTFEPAVTYDSGGYSPFAVAVADVNGDGKPDVIVANQCVSSGECYVAGSEGVVAVLLGNGDGTFQAALTYASGGSSATSVAVVDVNGDGKPDLLVVNWLCNSDCENGSVGVLLGNGDGTFQPAVAYGSGGSYAVAVAVADVNGDGKPDLLVANDSCNLSSVTAGAGVLLGNGDGTFQTAVTYCSGGASKGAAPSASVVAVADVNGDGKPDLLMANYCSPDLINGGCSDATGTVGVLLGNGDGTFASAAVTYGSGGFGTDSVAVADVNGDGWPDVLVANSCASSLSCNGSQQGSVGVLINTRLEATATSLLSSLNPSSFGQTVTFTATVTTQRTGTPTGTVSFSDQMTNLGNSSLDGSGLATLSISTLSVGTHPITATYSGDANFSQSASLVSQVVQGAVVTLSQTSLNFGTQTVGITSTPENVILSNTGNIPLTISAIGITGTNNADFAQTNNCGTSVLAGNSCTITLAFTPSSTGWRYAAVSITDNAANSPQHVALSGIGLSPFVIFSPPSLSFGNQEVGTTGTQQVSTVTNNGAGILDIVSIEVTGTSRNDFTETNNCGASLAPGATCTVTVNFTPTASGTRNAAVSMTDNAPHNPQRLPLNGTGVLPAVTFSHTSVTFSNQVVFTTSNAKAVTLTNTGLGILNITNIAATGAFSQTNTCGTTVNPSASCSISVTFSPETLGTLTGFVTITDNALKSPQKLTLTGTGTYVQLAPTSVNFHNQPVGTTSLTKRITLSNKGSVAVNITGISFAGTNATDFSQTNTCGTSVAGGASCFINVKFKPSATGTRTAQVAVSDDGGGSPQKVNLTGTGTP